MRRLFSYVYGAKPGDWESANFIHAVQPPGSETDIGPPRLITEVTANSKSDSQRSERVATTSKTEDPPKGKVKEKQGTGRDADHPRK